MRSLRWAVSMVVMCLACSAQAARVAVVQSDDLPPYTAPIEAFLDELGEPALVLNLHGRRSEAEAIAKRLRREDPEVVFVLGAKAAYTIHQRLPNARIVYAVLHDPVRYGVTGNRVTGVPATVQPAHFLSQFAGFFPETGTIGVLRGPLATDERIAASRAAAETLQVRLEVADVDSVREARRAFFRMLGKVDAIWLQPDRTMLSTELFRVIAEETRRRRVPLLVETDNMVRAGALFAVVPDPDAVGAQAARLVKAILDGASPAVLSVDEAPSSLVVLNQDTVEQSGIALNPLLLDFVDVLVD